MPRSTKNTKPAVSTHTADYPTSLDDYLTITDAARVSGYHEKHLRRLCQAYLAGDTAYGVACKRIGSGTRSLLLVETNALIARMARKHARVHAPATHPLRTRYAPATPPQ